MRHDPVRERLEAQGYEDLREDTLHTLDPWLRIAPAITAVWAALATAQGSVPGLAALVPFALAGVVLGVHPFDALLTPLRRRAGGPEIPPHGLPRRFAALLAAGLLEGATWAFAAGLPALGTILGAVVVASAAIHAATGFCVSSWLYALVFGPAVGPASATSECP